MISLDGWSSSNNFKIDYSSREIFPVGWCKLAGIRIAKVGGNRMSSNKIPNKQNVNLRQEQSKTVISPLSNHLSYSPTPIDEKNQINNFKKEHPTGMKK
jgi:hypothetical protein